MNQKVSARDVLGLAPDPLAPTDAMRLESAVLESAIFHHASAMWRDGRGDTFKECSVLAKQHFATFRTTPIDGLETRKEDDA